MTGAPPAPPSSLILTRVCDGAAAPEASQVMRQFPPRPRPGLWPAAGLDREQVSGLLLADPFPLDSYGAQRQRAASLKRVLDWLGSQPGATWQERWTASGAEGTARWRDLVPGFPHRGHGPAGGVLLLICGDVIRPDAGWLLECSGLRLLTAEMARTRDPAGFTRLREICEAEQISELICDLSLRRIAAIMAAKGGAAGDITAGDCLELASAVSVIDGPRGKGMYFYQLLRAAGGFPPQAPASVRMFATRGQLSPAELIGRYGIECRPVRDLLVDYLREHQLAVDYATLRAMAHALGSLFWRDLERHHPGISSLRLSAEVAAGWKQRITRKPGRARAGAGGSAQTVPRASSAGALFTVRAFYLDIAQWAADDPARWAQWAAPCPVRAEEIPHAKEVSRRKARMDQRTRERLPVLPVLLRSAAAEREASAARLAACRGAQPGELFSAGGQELRRAVLSPKASARIWAEDPATSTRRDLTLEEHRGFWAWAAIEVLRHSGMFSAGHPLWRKPISTFAQLRG